MQKIILRLPEVKKRTGLSRSTIYLKIKQRVFPRPISLGTKAVGWLEAEIEAWLEHRIAASRSGDAESPTDDHRLVNQQAERNGAHAAVSGNSKRGSQ